ncbi:hypothetical protein F2Q68_00011980 [Brassica cretica]|uniref:Uncharacterized protein n=1 Tax=Brassica cretica TaxID=69181 RepID=A0A8S9L5T1_BRACR|nr:hypothetical protein F2Q68_00011980 [Brassica cretica]
MAFSDASDSAMFVGIDGEMNKLTSLSAAAVSQAMVGNDNSGNDIPDSGAVKKTYTADGGTEPQELPGILEMPSEEASEVELERSSKNHVMVNLQEYRSFKHCCGF